MPSRVLSATYNQLCDGVIMSGQVFVSQMGALRASGRGTFSCAALLAFLSIVGFGLAAERDYDYYASQSRIRLEPEVHVFTCRFLVPDCCPDVLSVARDSSPMRSSVSNHGSMYLTPCHVACCSI